MTGEQYSQIPDDTKLRIECDFAHSWLGEVFEDCLTGKCGREWQERAEAAVRAKVKVSALEAA